MPDGNLFRGTILRMRIHFLLVDPQPSGTGRTSVSVKVPTFPSLSVRSVVVTLSERNLYPSMPPSSTVNPFCRIIHVRIALKKKQAVSL